MRKICTIVCVCLFAVMCFSSHKATATPKLLSAIHLTGLNHISEAVVRNVLPLKAGDRFDIAKVDQAMTFLRRWGVFDTIQTSINETPKGVVLTFDLDEATVITAINITGAYPFVENKIRKYLTIHAGDIYTPKNIEEQIHHIGDFYKRQGFINTEVSVEEKVRPLEGGVDLTFHIHRGQALRYRTMTIRGNQAFPSGRFVSAINPLKPHSEVTLRKALRTLTTFYREHGYPKAKLQITDKSIDFSEGKVDLIIDVDEGPHVRVRFRGNRTLGDRALKKTITVFREGSFDAFEIDASRRAIQDAYHKRGFPYTEVSTTEEVLRDGRLEITFHVNEGLPQSIKRVQFHGNQLTSARVLREGMRNKSRATGVPGRYRPESVNTDTARVQVNLESQGFLQATVEPWKVDTTPDGFSLLVTIPVQEGEKTIVDHITFTGNTAIGDALLLKQLKIAKHKAFNPHGLDDDRQRLLIFYADNGYPYAEIKQSTTTNPNHTASIHYDINEGKRVTFGEILIVGDVLTSQKAIKKAMGIRTGEPFSYKRVLQAQLSIKRLGPFAAANVETIGLAEKEEVIHLRVKVDEERPFHVDVGFRYSTDEQYAGTLSFTNLNAFGWAKRNTLKFVGGPELSRAELGWLDPKFLGSSFEFTTNGWIQYKREPAFTFMQLAGASGLFRRYRSFGLLMRFELDRNYFVEGSSTAADAQSLRDNTIAKTSLSSSYDTRDSFSDPRRGVYIVASGDLFNEIRGKEANFAKLSLLSEYDYSLIHWLTFASAGRFQRIQTIGSNVSVPSNELLFLGGDDSIRGFAEDRLGPVDASGNATGGRMRWVINEEARLRMSKKISLALFYDVGQLVNTFDALSFGDVRHAAGFGLRYLTPVGPIRADYGFKIDRQPGESLGRFHLTFGYVF